VEQLNRASELPIPANLIRTVAIVGVIVLHAANEAIAPQAMNTLEIYRWWMVDIYQTLSRVGVPLFVMLTGALLLQPSKCDEPLGVFFKKRWARIGLPFLFWGVAYFAWSYFVHGQALTSSVIMQGILSGPYFHFWYLYMLVGLYLFTPILRIFVAHANRNVLKYFVIIWFLGPLIVPLPSLLGNYNIDSNLLTIPWWIGYFVLGAYLMNVRVRRSTLLILMTAMLTATVVGTYMIAATVGGPQTYFFQDYFSPTTILASATVFLLLNTLRAPANPAEITHPKANWLVNGIGQNTLTIFLFHVMVLEALQLGLLGFTISGNTLNSIVEIPLISAVALFICIAVILPLKKIPVVKNAIG
jgi:surface polysaccharide O-acyltransferase-like enzyme